MNEFAIFCPYRLCSYPSIEERRSGRNYQPDNPKGHVYYSSKADSPTEEMSPTRRRLKTSEVAFTHPSSILDVTHLSEMIAWLLISFKSQQAIFYRKYYVFLFFIYVGVICLDVIFVVSLNLG